MKEFNYNGHIVHVFEMGEECPYLTKGDKEMDRLAREAVRVAISNAKYLNLPVAGYDSEKQQAYIEYPDGRREYRE